MVWDGWSAVDVKCNGWSHCGHSMSRTRIREKIMSPLHWDGSEVIPRSFQLYRRKIKIFMHWLQIIAPIQSAVSASWLYGAICFCISDLGRYHDVNGSGLLLIRIDNRWLIGLSTGPTTHSLDYIWCGSNGLPSQIYINSRDSPCMVDPYLYECSISSFFYWTKKTKTSVFVFFD